MLRILKNRYFQIITAFCLGSVITYGASEGVRYVNVEDRILKYYVKEVEVNDKNKRIVILINNDTFFNNISSNNEYMLDRLKKSLDSLNYSYVIIHAPCQLYRCTTDFYDISKYISKIKPEEVIFHSPSSGWNTDIFYETLNKDNIPIIVFHTDVSIFYSKYVGVDNEEIGKKIGRYINGVIIEKEKVLVIHTLKGVKNSPNDNGLPRIESAMKELSKAEVLESSASLWSKSRSYDIVIEYVKMHPDISWIVAPSYETAKGASEALLEAGLLNKINIAVLDFSLEIAQEMERGIFDVAVSHNITRQINEIVRTISVNDYIFNDRNKPKKLFSGPVIPKENVHLYRNNDGSYRL